MAMTARIWVTLKPGVLDPQGKAIAGALGSLGFSGVEDVRQGKYLEVKLDAHDEQQAHRDVERMCEELLANTVIETYRFQLEPA
jgi:phosphoribosylformylglycinamidine synthase subunit PurS